MKNECSIIRDLLPLYAEKMVSPDTATFVKEHLNSCENCRNEYEKLKEPHPPQNAAAPAPLLKLKKKMTAKKIQIIALTAVFAIALFVSAFAVLDAPIYLPYSENLITVEPVGDHILQLTFDEKVTDFDYAFYPDPDGKKHSCCQIQAWTSLWDQWFSNGEGKLSTTIYPKEPYPITIVYLPNDGTENVCVYGDSTGESNITLPRLSLGYYLILAIAALAAAALVWFLIKKKADVRVWVERIGLYPAAYLISHCIVSGINWNSYSLPRDFSLILFLSILLYSGLLLFHNIWRLKREMKKIDPAQGSRTEGFRTRFPANSTPPSNR